MKKTPVLEMVARTACDCGCQRPARVIFETAGPAVSVSDPEAIDALIDELIKARIELWGERPRKDQS